MPSSIAVDIFIPCFVDQLYPATALNMVKVLERVGVQVHYNAGQTCCGQPAYNAGYHPQSRAVAEKFLADFAAPATPTGQNTPSRYIVSPSASCVGMVRNSYTELFAGRGQEVACQGVQVRTYELTELLVKVLGITAIPGAQLQGKYTYHDSCSALRECGIRAAPRQLLDAVAGLERLEMAETTTCCGFGGTFAVKFEAISVAMAQQKVEHALDTGADFIISTDVSCLMHLEAYIKKEKLPLKCLHIADVLASGW
ncbi:(Fe-S)-binding protein [Hymenobacter sp. BT683]|uniref:(Fe-S)-binding protein n=1 Tax=Hymenobacter jeongseonensis TaxID=2791027 RepID=A0ABS0IKC6_9BACT|nr:(Fe-S)-binding protein [Hymenobacter jeongseonensis]MBF9238806.1 (Fe-S)-binding protein [Hymenobacter jeongseonensis]